MFRYCYELSNGGNDPVILLVDNCPAHTPPSESKPWTSGDLLGYRMSNVLFICFAPNCTSKIQPLDVGCIQCVKAMYKKRHMRWILKQLACVGKDASEPLEIRCNVRQAMEWFVAATHEVSPDTVKNCWAVTKILTPAQTELLETGVRHNNRNLDTRRMAIAGVTPAEIDELYEVLANAGKGLSADECNPIKMADPLDLL